jgi:hypothetical protein
MHPMTLSKFAVEIVWVHRSKKGNAPAPKALS